MKSSRLFLILVCSLLAPASIRAQWVAPGTTIANTLNSQHVIVMVSDGAGGAIMAWDGYRTGNFPEDIYAQRISSTGVPLWTANGVPICTAASFQYYPEIASDGAGGAIITWMDYRNPGLGDIYAQRVNGSGTPLWTTNGVVVCNAVSDQQWPTIASDGSGGALISWADIRNGGTSWDIYVQRVNSAGTSLWTANGVPLTAVASPQEYPRVVSDAAGGAIVTWMDSRPSGTQPDIYAQRVNSVGVPQWIANGLPVCAVPGTNGTPYLIADGVGGSIIAWDDFRAGSANDIYAQRVSGAGTALWTPNGAPVCTASGDQLAFKFIPDGAQGALFSWMDLRGPNSDIYAQHISSEGKPLWLNDGTPVCTATGNQNGSLLATDGAGGGIVAWNDYRNPSGEFYGQRIDVNGTPRWTVDGMRLTASPLTKWNSAMVSDGNGNAIVGWYSYIGSESSVFAQRVEGRYGYWGKPEPALFAAKDVPADQGGKVRLEWYASGRDVLNQNTITHYTIWRAIDQAAFASAAASGVPELKITDLPSKFTGKAIRHEKAQAVDYFWELIGEQNAFYRYAYSFNAATTFDSTATNAATHRFQILSHAGSDLTNWPSNVLSGRSVDNLAPPAPLSLTAQRIGNYVYLKWNGVHVPDLNKYTVYRATSTGVTPIPPNFLADGTDTLLTDASAPASALYYIVTATDVHQNQGVKSNEAAVAAATGAGNLPPVTALTVLQNHPNPFTGSTQLQVGLPVKSDVRVEIFDVAGRRVRSALLSQQAKGWSTLRLDARGDRGDLLPSGVYFYRVHAGNEAVTRKMVITR